MQRPAKYANQEFFTEAQREELDKERAALLGRTCVASAGPSLTSPAPTTTVFMSTKHTGARTSLIVDPPNGRIPPLTPEAQKVGRRRSGISPRPVAIDRDVQEQGRCCARRQIRSDALAAARGTSSSLQHRRRINRHDGPEDGTLADRCLTGGLPEFGAFAGGSFRRIVQTPGGISMFYDVGQGQGWQRNIVMNGSPHLPASIRQWYGDSRGHWEGNTLVIDVTNFSPKTDFQGSRENLHLVERWTRTGPTTLEYVVTIEDPTVWTRPWTVKQEFTKQSEEENRIYYEPRCIEGNYAFPALMHGGAHGRARLCGGTRSRSGDQGQRRAFL